jgi:hypothetical protein
MKVTSLQALNNLIISQLMLKNIFQILGHLFMRLKLEALVVAFIVAQLH